MTKRTNKRQQYQRCNGLLVELDFSGGVMTSNGGVLAARQAERRTNLVKNAARGFKDGRQRGKVRHSPEAMLLQRVIALMLGHPDVSHHNRMRHDPALQTAVGRDSALASAPTLCRLENGATREWAVHTHKVLAERFIASHESPPEEVVLDIDATDDLVHGGQEGRFFSRHYDGYCFLPLYVFAGDHPLAAYLRPADRDAARHSAAVVKLLAGRLRRAWPGVRIVVRADSGFCRSLLMDWCDRNGVHYILGLARNPRVVAQAETEMARAADGFGASGEKQRRFADLLYGARTWSRERRVVARLEHGPLGPNPRFVVTNMEGDAQSLYEDVYCARGDMENRIKEQQLQLFADRTSCRKWWANQFRLLEAVMAHSLFVEIRHIGLWGTSMARAQVATIRNRLLKVGAVIVRNTRRIRFMLSSSCPDKELIVLVARRLEPGYPPPRTA